MLPNELYVVLTKFNTVVGVTLSKREACDLLIKYHVYKTNLRKFLEDEDATNLNLIMHRIQKVTLKENV